MYVCSENDFHYRNAQKSQERRESKAAYNINGIEMQTLLSTIESQSDGKERESFDLCHIIYDLSSFLITFLEKGAIHVKCVSKENLTQFSRS